MPKEPCSSCAFREGCETFTDPYNRLRSMVASLGAVPFFCHKGKLPNFRRLCAGWKAEVAKLAAQGHFRDPQVRHLRKIAAQHALTQIEVFTDKDKTQDEKDAAHREISWMLELLTDRGKDDENRLSA